MALSVDERRRNGCRERCWPGGSAPRGGPRRDGGRWGLAATAWLALLLASAVPGAAATLRVSAGSGMVAAYDAADGLFLEAVPERGEGMLRFAERLCGTTGRASEVSAANGGARRLLKGVRYRVPFELLTGEYQLLVARALFAGDEAEADGWRHRVRAPEGAGPPSLWRVSEWFTGRGDNYRNLRAANGLDAEDLQLGQVLWIPGDMLRPAFRAVLPPPTAALLEYGEDARGEYAVYRLQKGEALYSSVVVRFTGRVFAEDVNSVADTVAERSGIRDVTDIPIGYRVKVPLDLLQPEFLPPAHPRRREYEEGLMASARFSNQVTADRLQGVTVVLDAGHGGADVGASMGGVWESLYVYDIMLRCRRILEASTAARVISTTQDGSGPSILERDRLPYSKSHRVLTTPNYRIEDSTVGVHLRWYLVNSIFRQTVAAGADSARLVFVSIHADSLHPSLRGAMAYVPGARYRGGTYGKSGAVYAARREVREGPRVSFSRTELVRSEGLSRDLAASVLDRFAAAGLAIHPDKPIREKVIRQRRAWVPAVLRYNAIPAQILLEVCNLANADDRALIQTRDFRQRVAEAIAQGILDYYGDSGAPAGPRVAASSP